MGRFLPILALLSLLACPSVRAQTDNRPAPARTKPDDFLGLRFAGVPDVLYAHLHRVRRGTGVVVEQVRANSPADRAGLRKYDILISCNGQELTDGDQLVRLLRSRRPQGKVPLVLLRHGREMTLEVNLPRAFKLAAAEEAKRLRGVAKDGPPPAVTVRAMPTADGKLQVTFEYAPDGKSRQVTLHGSLDEIQTQAKTQLPPEVQDLAQVALDRLRPKKSK